MNFVFLSTMHWTSADGAYAPTRLSQELARRGHHVIFIHTFKTEPPPDTRGLPLCVLALDELGLPNFLVALSWRGLYVGALAAVWGNLAPILENVGARGEPWIAVLNAPYDPFVRLLPFLQEHGSYLVYYPQDDYAGMAQLGFSESNLEQQQELVTHADLVISLSETVSAILGSGGRSVGIVPDAVDPEEFRAHAADGDAPNVLRGQAATLGYWGTLVDPMVDSQLLVQLARSRPEWAFNLIGPTDLLPGLPSVYEPLSGLDNVRFFGPIAHSQLCRYAASFDVCLVPAPDNAMSRGRDPLKVYEYLAVYKPIVATHTPQLTNMPFVRVAYNLAQTVDAIQAALGERVDRAAIDSFLVKHSWSARADSFLEHISAMLARPPAAYGALDAAKLESFGEAQRVGILSAEEWAAIRLVVRERADMGAQLGLAAARADRAEERAEQAEEHMRAAETKAHATAEQLRIAEMTLHANAEQTQKLESWAHELQAANRAQQRDLERLNNFLPIRLARRLRRKSRDEG